MHQWSFADSLQSPLHGTLFMHGNVWLACSRNVRVVADKYMQITKVRPLPRGSQAFSKRCRTAKTVSALVASWVCIGFLNKTWITMPQDSELSWHVTTFSIGNKGSASRRLESTLMRFSRFRDKYGQ